MSYYKEPPPQLPIDQPAYVGGWQGACGPIVPIAGVPQPNEYVTSLDPVFVQHISRHQGQPIAVETTCGRIEGLLAGVAVDHIQINRDDRSMHIRIAHIVYFEGPAVSYR
ncbi:DUF2642 domain-containing protein [Paenibacillus albicereus]|uniref:DUF2642 domain-containing protein n=1 Tax=Paenibacillus albicereus TaxID=2726185 RepID=A0A6H2GVT4_9BACL|nr:DUF2642 domain-containing protein [Paenibacillus albicereus]QJC51276.1 DUF2642 domain-containing protein [Paenibacillus albicereus]